MNSESMVPIITSITIGRRTYVGGKLRNVARGYSDGGYTVTLEGFIFPTEEQMKVTHIHIGESLRVDGNDCKWISKT